MCRLGSTSVAAGERAGCRGSRDSHAVLADRMAGASPGDDRTKCAGHVATVLDLSETAQSGRGCAAAVDLLTWPSPVPRHRRRMLADGALTAPMLLEVYLQQVSVWTATCAYRVQFDRARAEAEAAQQRLDAGERLPLLGVPIA